MYEHARQLEAIMGTPSSQKRQQNGLHLNLKSLNIAHSHVNRRPYHAELIGSHSIIEVKQHRALSVLGWVLLAQIFSSFFAKIRELSLIT